MSIVSNILLMFRYFDILFHYDVYLKGLTNKFFKKYSYIQTGDRNYEHKGYKEVLKSRDRILGMDILQSNELG